MFKVSKVFGNDMVLQRDEVVRVWGWSDEEGGTVAVDFKGLRGSAVVADGEWTVTLDGTLPADTTPADLTVTAPDGGETVFTGVLVGDVYLVTYGSISRPFTTPTATISIRRAALPSSARTFATTADGRSPPRARSPSPRSATSWDR